MDFATLLIDFIGWSASHAASNVKISAGKVFSAPHPSLLHRPRRLVSLLLMFSMISSLMPFATIKVA
jgi:hypothetical protein